MGETCIKRRRFSQDNSMKKSVVFEEEGKSRDERESCFPNMTKLQQRKGAGTR